MNRLSDILATQELQRWRLILGEAAENSLGGLDEHARQVDHALEWLYGRDPERLRRGERQGGLEDSSLTTPEWINAIHSLFPQPVIERLESDAVLRYGIDEVVTNLEVLERIEPSESLLRAVLHTKHLMNPDVLNAARKLVRQVVEQIMARLATEVRQAFSARAIGAAPHVSRWRATSTSRIPCAPTSSTGTRSAASCTLNRLSLSAVLNATAKNGS